LISGQVPIAFSERQNRYLGDIPRATAAAGHRAIYNTLRSAQVRRISWVRGVGRRGGG